VGKIAKKLSEGARFLLIQHSKYSAMLSSPLGTQCVWSRDDSPVS